MMEWIRIIIVMAVLFGPAWYFNEVKMYPLSMLWCGFLIWLNVPIERWIATGRFK